MIARWLLDIEARLTTFRFSDVPGEADGHPYYPGLIVSDPPGVRFDVESVRISADSVALAIAPGVEVPLFDAYESLRGALATFSLLREDETRIDLVTGRIEDLQLGGDIEPTTFSIVEQFAHDPLFPQELISSSSFASTEIVASAIGKPWTRVYGSPAAVPGVPVRVDSSGEAYVMYAGHKLGPNVVPWTGFPSDKNPSSSDRKPNTIIGLRVGKNRALRDAFADSAINAGWLVDSGVWSETASVGNLRATGFTGPGKIVWTGWQYEEEIDIAARVDWGQAAGSADFYFGYIDVGAFVRLRFTRTGTAATDTVVLEVSKGSIVHTQPSPAYAPKSAFPASGGRVMIAGTRQSLSVTFEDPTSTNSESWTFSNIPRSLSGRFGLGANLSNAAHWVQFGWLTQPVQTAGHAGADDQNDQITHYKDNNGIVFAGEKFKADPPPMFADFFEAQDVINAAELVAAVLGSDPAVLALVDEGDLAAAQRVLSSYTIGSYFDDQQKVFDVINERLGPQFFFGAYQRAGKIRIAALDLSDSPTIVRSLLYPVDFLEFMPPIEVGPVETYFSARFEWDAARNVWAGREIFTRDDSPALNALYSAFGKIDSDEVDLPDVVTVPTTREYLRRRAKIRTGARIFRYRQTADWMDELRLGLAVSITDADRGLSSARAIVVEQKPLSPTEMMTGLLVVTDLPEY